MDGVYCIVSNNELTSLDKLATFLWVIELCPYSPTVPYGI